MRRNRQIFLFFMLQINTYRYVFVTLYITRRNTYLLTLEFTMFYSCSSQWFECVSFFNSRIFNFEIYSRKYTISSLFIFAPRAIGARNNSRSRCTKEISRKESYYFLRDSVPNFPSVCLIFLHCALRSIDTHKTLFLTDHHRHVHIKCTRLSLHCKFLYSLSIYSCVRAQVKFRTTTEREDAYCVAIKFIFEIFVSVTVDAPLHE